MFASSIARTRLAGSCRSRLICLVTLGLMVIIGCAHAAAGPADRCPNTPHRIETFSLFVPALDRSKRIYVYLPLGYDCAKGRRYPVFYFNDGQDLFESDPLAPALEPAVAREIAEREAWYGSWRLDRQIDRAIADDVLPPLIVVGIASDDGMRSRDLAPVPWDGSSEGRGVPYGAFVAEAVVSAVDDRFRTIARRRCRGIGGASLGGVSALQIGLGHADRFGLVLSFSPVVRDRAIADHLAAAWSARNHSRRSTVVVDFDDDPIGAADLSWFASMIAASESSVRPVSLVQTPGGRHAIDSWARRVVPALVQLLDATCAG
jgi:enterochelin esterase-like enzyme